MFSIHVIQGIKLAAALLGPVVGILVCHRRIVMTYPAVQSEQAPSPVISPHTLPRDTI